MVLRPKIQDFFFRPWLIFPRKNEHIGSLQHAIGDDRRSMEAGLKRTVAAKKMHRNGVLNVFGEAVIIVDLEADLLRICVVNVQGLDGFIGKIFDVDHVVDVGFREFCDDGVCENMWLSVGAWTSSKAEAFEAKQPGEGMQF